MKPLLWLTILLAALFCSGALPPASAQETATNMVEEVPDMYEIESRLDQALQSDLPTDQKEAAVRDILKQCEDAGGIVPGSVYWEPSTKTFTFEYANGVLGACRLEPFAGDMDMG